jgi:hypothetical protein
LRCGGVCCSFEDSHDFRKNSPIKFGKIPISYGGQTMAEFVACRSFPGTSLASLATLASCMARRGRRFPRFLRAAQCCSCVKQLARPSPTSPYSIDRRPIHELGLARLVRDQPHHPRRMPHRPPRAVWKSLR